MKKFIITFAISFIAFYILEHVVSEMFGFDLDTLNYGWLGYAGIVLFYGFKFHVICCLIPLIFTAYKCRHKKCKHEYCDSGKLENKNTTIDRGFTNDTWVTKNK